MHHAYLIIGSTLFIDAELSKYISEAPVDCVWINVPSLGVADVRALSEQAGRRPLISTYRVIVIRTESLTHEAQNALLKLFEDPSPTTRFILTLPRDTLIPTLRSRVHVISESEQNSISSQSTARTFQEQTYARRLEIIANLATQKDDQAMRSLAHTLVINNQTTRDEELLTDLLLISTFIDRRGASKKMLLEHIALSVPKY